MEIDIVAIVSGLFAKFPVIGTILTVIGGLRLVIKPIMSCARSLAEVIPGTKDTETLNAIEESKIYKIVVYVLDWFASIKLPGAK